MSTPHDTVLTEHTGDASLPSARYLALFQEGSSRVVPLPEGGELVVGRGDECGLRLDDVKISRKHLCFELGAERVVASDLESQNGTFLNGERMQGSRVLVSGDVIELGRVALVFHAAKSRAEGAAIGFHELRVELEQEIARATRSGKPISVISLVAPSEHVALLADELVGLERIAAAGADHIALVLPEVSPEDAEKRVDALLSLLKREGVSARAGVAAYPADGCEGAALFVASESAAANAQPGARSDAKSAFRTLELGSKSVVVADAAMQRLYGLIERLAASDLPVLIHGETGCGKELAAQALHHLSKRAGKRLVAINCAALHTSLVESELFGHEKGAFTGATSAKAGYLEAASGGTVFFDEIGELPLGMQAKLLRALDTRRVTRLGEVEERPIDVRVVAATNRNLEQEVAAGRFRQDLYFRLSGATLWVPPLRDRPRELSILAKRFLDSARERLGKPSMRISDESMQLLSVQSWPGNVRELANVMEFAAAAFDDPVLERWQLESRVSGSSSEPPEPVMKPAPGFRSLEEEIRELEQKRIQSALDSSGGNQKRAAQLIGMPLRTFVSKLTQYGLRPARR
jgi:DNA-binding NtrC family response regulator/pSer/pThr/pTyr-binding forkhead associated (FHA) protein